MIPRGQNLNSRLSGESADALENYGRSVVSFFKYCKANI